jgi:dTDP-L-rhamnose 4-epimerase
MAKRVLVTGGAGFIGSFIVDRLVKKGHQVRILDNLDPQVHENSIPPKYLNRQAEFVNGNVCDRQGFHNALKGIDIVFHMASCVGVSQSQYEIGKYTEVNCLGAALLWDIIVQEKLSVEKVILPSSMTCIGEGNSRCENCGIVKPRTRKETEVSPTFYSCRCPNCNNPVSPVATSSTCKLEPSSIYALSKKYQEELTLLLSRLYNIPAVVLRYFNVYGPRQSLSNPYTGVGAIFISRIKNGKNPVVYEDGLQTRDFISVHDVVEVNIAAMESNVLDYQVLNFGSGIPVTISDLAAKLIGLLKSDVQVEVSRKFRKGDIRHCFADKNEIEQKLNYRPQVSLEKGLLELAEWATDQQASDGFEKATSELRNKGII